MSRRILENVEQPQKKVIYTWSDYLGWAEEDRFELIRGEAFSMSPAPSTKHQRILGNLHGFLWSYVRNGPCTLFLAPTDLKLSPPEEDDFPTVLQPDLMIVCDSDSIGEQAVEGAPELVVEILSPRTAGRDEHLKKKLYEAAGVSEYWIVYPNEGYIVRYAAEDGRFGDPEHFTPPDELESRCFPGLKINVSELFS